MVNGGTYSYEYHLKDHLGNTRVAYSDANNNGSIEGDEILQVTDYYPFGMRHEIEGYPNHANQKYLYNGKELQEETGWYDYGARMYDASLGRFHSIDPFSESFSFQSPFIYASNNPINNVDVIGGFSFDAQQLEYIKQNYPSAYEYIMQSDASKPGIMQWANEERITGAMIDNTPNEVFNSPNSPDYGMDWTVQDHQILTQEVIEEAFTPGNGPTILVDKDPGGTEMAGGHNAGGNSGTKYSGPMEINEELFKALNDAKNPEEKKIAMMNLIGTILHEYQEYFNDDYIRDLEGNTIGGIRKAQREIFGGTDPGMTNESDMIYPQQDVNQIINSWLQANPNIKVTVY